jgi:hypothetical protein
VAAVRAALGELDGAFNALERIVDEGGLRPSLTAAEWDPLRADAVRWRRILEIAGFPEDLIARAMAGR